MDESGVNRVGQTQVMAGVVLIHGAWHGGWSWMAAADRLRELGLDVAVVDQLPSTRGDAMLGLYADAAHVREVVDQLEHDRVVVVGHSYGAMVLSELAGNNTISHAFYIAGFAPERGKAVLDLIKGPPPEWVLFSEDGGFSTVDKNMAGHLMAANAPSPEIAERHVARMVPQAVLATAQPSTISGWGSTPVTYILAEEDEVIPPELQETMARAVGARLVRVSTPHFPMYSELDLIVDLIASAARQSHASVASDRRDTSDQ